MMRDNVKMTSIICLTVVLCVALMSSCVQNTGFF